jgi:hypothetical protein
MFVTKKRMQMKRGLPPIVTRRLQPVPDEDKGLPVWRGGFFRSNVDPNLIPRMNGVPYPSKNNFIHMFEDGNEVSSERKRD